MTLEMIFILFLLTLSYKSSNDLYINFLAIREMFIYDREKCIVTQRILRRIGEKNGSKYNSKNNNHSSI